MNGRELKILVVGDGHSKIHEVAVAKVFGDLGYQVKSFFWSGYLSSTRQLGRLCLLAQNKYIFGPSIRRINQDLVALCRSFQPDLIFVYRGTHIRAKTIREMKSLRPNAIIVGYNNDDPFAPGHPSYLWKTFLRAVPEYDLVLAYRHHNIDQFRRIGAKRVELLRSWFLPWQNQPIILGESDQTRFKSDVVFVGHLENDGRTEMLEAVVQQGWRLRLFGPGKHWNQRLISSPELKAQIPVSLVWGDDYNRALCGSKIALCFLSKLNRDSYTRRCFEIPATGTLLLSEFTPDLAGMFEENKEAVYFRSKEELLQKIDHFLNHDDERKAIAKAGYQKVYSAGHDIISRMKYVLELVDSIRKGKL